MQATNKLILVCAGADTVPASRFGYPLLQLCIGVGANGVMQRLRLPAQMQDHFLGISDLGITGTISSLCAESLILEAKHRHMRGIFADFERDDPAVHQLLSMLDRQTHDASIPLFVPLRQAPYVQHAYLVAETALSGGSFEEYFSELDANYPQRICAALRPISTDFCLPATDSEGTPLSAAERLLRMQQHHAQAFFSRELCAKYFTYMDDKQAGHFVLFDDNSTLKAKLQRLERLRVSYVFALYPDIQGFLTESWQ